jgi:hypothetical protein
MQQNIQTKIRKTFFHPFIRQVDKWKKVLLFFEHEVFFLKLTFSKQKFVRIRTNNEKKTNIVRIRKNVCLKENNN